MPNEWMNQLSETIEPLIRQVVGDEMNKRRKQVKRWLKTPEAEDYVGGRRMLENLVGKGLHKIRNVGVMIYDRNEIDQLLESMKF
jgi:hypothetical protein